MRTLARRTAPSRRSQQTSRVSASAGSNLGTSATPGRGQLLEHPPAVPVREADELMSLAPQQAEHRQATTACAPHLRRQLHSKVRRVVPGETMGPSSALISMQAAILGVQAFLIGLYVQRRFVVEDRIRAHCQAVEKLADRARWVRAQAEYDAAEGFLRSSDPIGGGWRSGELTMLRRLSVAFIGLYVLAYFAICGLMLGWADPSTSRGRVVGTSLTLPLPKVASLLLAATTLLLGLAGAGLLRGRRRVIDEQMKKAEERLVGKALDRASAESAARAEGH